MQSLNVLRHPTLFDIILVVFLTLIIGGCGGGGGGSTSSANVAPVANAGIIQNVTTGTVVTLNGSASTDANSDQLTYSWTLTSKPASSTAALTGATSAAPTFTADLAGTYVVTLVVNDGTVNSTAATVTITATVANAAPVANAGTAQNVTTGTVVTLNGSASSDANSDPLTYSWTLTSTPAGSGAALTGATSAAPTFTADLAGAYVATLVVNDGKVNSTAATVTITATVANAAPVANAGSAQSVTTGTLVTLNGSASSDANSDPLTYSWTLTSTPAGSGAALTGATTAAPTFTADLAGTYVATLVVNDGKVNSTAATVTITATVANAAPVANAGTAQNVTTGTLVTLDGSASSDANSDPLTYSWTLTSKPASSSAALTGATTAVPTFTADVAGTYVASLVVNDGKVNSTAATVTITATVANAAPVANAGPAQNVTTGTVVTLNGSASSDANGDPLTYSWTLTSTPAGSSAVLTGATTAAPTFTADLAGTYVATLVVNDGKVNSTAATVLITVTVANAAPVANAGPAQSVTTGTLVTLDGSASSDANGDPLTYSWILTSKPASSTAALTGATSAAPTFTADLAGTYVATLVVNDGKVNSTAATVIITSPGYVVQGGLTWMPVTFTNNWANANAYCTNTTLNGQTGWRMPTQPELSALYTSGAMNGQGWTLALTWSSTPIAAGFHYFVFLANGAPVGWDIDTTLHYVSCVRKGPNAAPVANAGPAQIVTTGTLVTLDGSASSDANGDPLTYIWTLTSTPAGSGAVLAGATSAAPTFTADLAGTYVATLVVNDGTVNSTAATVIITSPGYVVQGGLTWMPVTFTNNWANANTYCTNTTINGQTGWRMPTQPELSALFASGAMNGQGWALHYTWSSTGDSAGSHYVVYLDYGGVLWYDDTWGSYVSCVR